MEGERYGNPTLVGNWYEDRFDKTQAPIPEFDRTGLYRETPLKMTQTTAADFISHSHSVHDYKQSVPVKEPIRIISKHSLHLTNHTRTPPSNLPSSGFGAVLNHHGADRSMRLLGTQTHSVHGGRDADDPAKRPLPIVKDQDVIAGRGSSSSASGIRCGGATDERLMLGNTDPKVHTFVQRAWWNADLNALNNTYQTKARADQQVKQNLEGLALKGLGEQDGVKRTEVRRKNNHTIRRDHGIWAE